MRAAGDITLDFVRNLQYTYVYQSEVSRCPSHRTDDVLVLCISQRC